MALKFLNKKGWHTGSLRNIENVWKAEQKHEAEQKKLEELRKQIQDERERSEFRLLQEQAGLVPRQERLDFLYDSGLAVGKGSGSASKGGESGVAFKAFEDSGVPGPSSSAAASDPAKQQQSVPGALFEDKPHSANDAWRKLHSDPLLLIRQREQEALARIKNNPVQMAIIRNSVKSSKDEEKPHERKERRKKHSHTKRKHHKHSSSHQSDSEDDNAQGKKRLEASRSSERYSKAHVDDAGYKSHENEGQRRKGSHRDSRLSEHDPKASVDDADHESYKSGGERRKSSHRDSRHREQSPRRDDPNHIMKNHGAPKDDKLCLEGRRGPNGDRKVRESRSSLEAKSYDSASHYKRRNVASKLSAEERAAKLREMQLDAELHEENRWKRLKKADDDDAREATRSSMISGKNFLDAAQKSVYGTERGGSSTIEESVRRRTHYSQGRSEVGDGNAFRR
ncbi:hypothetical protein Tsubulata_020700 [Turnera subulata]|uniref:CBF1-interacting co-repressor CIR N-terminal domain-containing protein n=1 Tax=Turnera subulata TaxID=218843 RepID=A0A9Q0FV35_9ROSI|nr:hypothetical protein Tsubulata_020700 [Turnera subulata]